MVQGTSPDWSWDGQLIAYQDIVNGSYEVFIMNADGSDLHCLTCNSKAPQEFGGKHKGKATLYPNGTYLLFSVENEHGHHGLATIPGIGDNHDFWVTNLQDQTYWRLTRLPKGSAIQYPRFSSDGKKLLWSQRYEKERGSIFRKGREFGFWKIKLADFEITDDGPALSNILDLEPGGKGYYEPHGFSPDGKTIIFTAMIQPGESAFYGRVYTLDLVTKELTNLAQTDNIHYEMAVYSPSGRKISFMSGPFIGVLRFGYRADLYLMDKDGSNRVRLTYFNEPEHPDYVGAACQIDKEAWSPDGSRIISAYYNHKTNKSRLFMITFEGACGKL
jgi:Tol biopolymer transport system component